MGLAEILNQPTRPTGMVSGYMSGLESGTNIAATNAQTAQQGLQSQRYAAETPGFLQRQKYDNETARLGTLPGQADEQAGVYQAESQSKLEKAKLEAQKVQAAYETLPAETKAKLHAEINKGTNALLTQVSDTLKQTGSIEQTIQSIEQQVPKVTQDPTWQAEKQKIIKMNPQQALAFIDQMRAKMASSAAYGSQPQQEKMIGADQQHQYDMELQRLRNEGNLAEVGARTVSAKNPTQAQFIREQIKIINPNAPEAEISKKTLEQMSIIEKMVNSGLLGEGMGTTTTSAKGGAEFNPEIIPTASSSKQQEYQEFLKVFNKCKTQACRDKATEMARERNLLAN
jgi:hypothetical protein